MIGSPFVAERRRHRIVNAEMLRVGEGDPACTMVARWLEGTGLADLWRKPANRSRRLN